MRIELHPEADAEFAAQVDRYEEEQPGLGQRFYREVIGCLDWIAANPTLSRVRKDHRRVNLKVFPFYVAYVVEGIWCGSSPSPTATDAQVTGGNGWREIEQSIRAFAESRQGRWSPTREPPTPPADAPPESPP